MTSRWSKGRTNMCTASWSVRTGVVLLLLMPLFAGCSNESQLNETRRRGDLVVVALSKFQRDHGRYPASLDELRPKYLCEIPLPTWGLKAWHYATSREGYEFGVNESVRTGDGDSTWLRYEGQNHGWQMGD
jgi:hypothetical protein